MAYYSILSVTPTTDTWVPAYLEVSGKVMAKYGGKYLARTTTHEQIEGEEQNAGLRIIIEWPSRQAALDFENDPEYAPHLKGRLEGSQSFHFLVNGKDDLAQ